MSNRAKPEWIVYTDGGVSMTNAGAGVIALDRQGLIAVVINRTLPLITNNEAEYAGLILALDAAARREIRHVEIRMDSEVVVNQMEGRFAVNSPKLKLLHIQACALARLIPKVHCVHIPRELNEVADALAADAAAGRRWWTGER